MERVELLQQLGRSQCLGVRSKDQPTRTPLPYTSGVLGPDTMTFHMLQVFSRATQRAVLVVFLVASLLLGDGVRGFGLSQHHPQYQKDDQGECLTRFRICTMCTRVGLL